MLCKVLDMVRPLFFSDEWPRSEAKNQSAQPALSVKSVELPVFRLRLKSAYQGISLNQFYDQSEVETNSSLL
jgi:hypothetical protein